MIVNAWNKEYKVHIKKSIYTVNGNLAIQLIEDDTKEPFATLTVNLGKLLPGYAYLDTNNCPWAIDFVEVNHLGEFTGYCRQSGFCEYPLYRFYEEKNNE